VSSTLVLVALLGQPTTLSELSGGVLVSPAASALPSMAEALSHAENRSSAVETGLGELETLYRHEVAPLVDVLLRRTRAAPLWATPSWAERIAVALVMEGREAQLDPRLLLAVLLVENPWLDPAVISPAGAIGLMQVMPFHAGAWGCPSNDLTHAETNICHGARILAFALERSDGDLNAALLRYNGCVRGTRTPDCHAYPSWVYGQAGQQWTADILAGGGNAWSTGQ
jgi:soluble lytic murein transglycosylase-like protein